jgi:hypothetical protein
MVVMKLKLQHQIDQLDAQLVYFSEEAERKIFKAHSVVNPILLVLMINQDFNNKDEMKEALKTLYRSNINPMREVIIDSLIGFSEPNISLKFKDFEELRIEEEVK